RTGRSSGETGSRTGVTGELSWLGGEDDADAAPGQPNPGRTGVTGQLDWRQSDFERQIEEAEQAAGVDWGDDDADDIFGTPSAFEEDDEVEEAPGWLSGTSAFDDDEEDEDSNIFAGSLEDDEGEDEPGWLSSTGE